MKIIFCKRVIFNNNILKKLAICTNTSFDFIQKNTAHICPVNCISDFIIICTEQHL